MSAFGSVNQSNTNDNWRLETTGGEAFWERNKKVRFQHVDTGVYLWCGRLSVTARCGLRLRAAGCSRFWS